MSDLGDLFLARLLTRAPYRRTIYTILALSAIGSLWFRAWMGRTEQVLPWYGALLSLYGFTLAFLSRDPRSRLVYIAFGVLVAAAFTRHFAHGWTRPVGLLETACSIAALGGLIGLARDRVFLRRPET